MRRIDVAGLAPGVTVLRGYRRAWLRGDLVAGVTVAAYIVPQVMAYAEVAGLPPVVGLWAALAPLAVYAVLGSSPQLSCGPESTSAIMAAVAVAPLAGGDPVRYAALAAALALLVGAICTVAWVARLGFLSELLSRPVLVGYMTGVAFLMISGQLGKLLGIEIAGEGFLREVWGAVVGLDEVGVATALLAAAVLVLLFAGARLFPRLPVPLFVVVLAAIAVALLDLEEQGVAVVGQLPQGLPSVTLPVIAWADLVALAPAALGVAIVAYNDNILTGRAFAARNGYRVVPNQEWLALGMANVGAGLTQGFPVSSSGSRTALGDAVGGRTQLSSLVTLGGLVAALVLLGGLLATFPRAALGAIVVYAAVRLIDVDEFRLLARFRGSELALAVGTTVAVLVFGILYGVLVAIALSVLDLLARVARPHDAVLGRVPGLAGMHDVEDYPSARTVPGLVVYRYDSPLFFANAEDFLRSARAAVTEEATRSDEPVRWFVLNAEANVEIDATAASALEDLRSDLAERGVVVGLARVKHELFEQLERAGLVAAVGRDRFFATLPVALGAYQRWRLEHGLPPV